MRFCVSMRKQRSAKKPETSPKPKLSFSFVFVLLVVVERLL